MAVASPTLDLLRARGVVFAHLAKLMGPDTKVWSDTTRLEELSFLFDALGDEGLSEDAELLAGSGPFDVDELAGQWIRWFDQGRLPPYECSNKLQGVAGHTGALADIAGFYKAFGMRVHGDRPDHIVAELEFLAVVTLAESDAADRGDAEQQAVSADVARTFLRDHAGGWVDAWAARVRATTTDGPWAQLASLINGALAAECRRRNVIPVRSDAAFTDVDLGFEDDSPEPICGAETEDFGDI